MKLSMFVASGLAVSLGTAAHAANIYMLSSGDPTTDNAAVAALTSRGHTVTVGLDYGTFDGSVNLTGFQTVYLQCNANWTAFTAMPTAGQTQLVNWVAAGGRLVTSEWVVYYTYAGGGKFETLAPIIPIEQSYTYNNLVSCGYTRVTANAAINAGLPANFAFPLFSYAGTETYSVVKSGATTYYTTDNSPGAAGLAGWASGSGSVFSFTSTCGPDQLADANFGRLFSNVMGAGGPAPCYPNCDSSTATPILNVTDFICFLNRFAAGEAYANCDNSTLPPSLNVNDFICYSNRFAAGCP